MTTRLFHISDVHFGVEDSAALAAVAQAVAQERPDAVVCTGDLTQRAKHSEYARAAEWFASLGVPVVLELESADVIHSFWVPHLSGKKDMIPGRRTLLRIEADRAGEFGGVCAEYCGGQHALMGFVAVAHPPADYRAWQGTRMVRVASASTQANDALSQAAGTTTQKTDGRALFMQSGCAACHRVAGTEANGLAGPDLTHVGSRRSLGAGVLPNHLGTLIGWIGDSQSIKPGNRMPSYDKLAADELEAIARWLEQQK